MGAPIQVLLADDHAIVRAGVRDICAEEDDINLIGEAKESDPLESLLLQLHPDVLLLDLKMPGIDALETVKFVHHRCQKTKVLIFSEPCPPTQFRELLTAGINGYVLKSEDPNSLLTAIRTAAQGDCWFSKPVLEALSIQPESKPDAQILTVRESQVLDLIGKGYNNQQIADELHLVKQTVANHVSCIYEKLGVQTRAEAILWRIEN